MLSPQRHGGHREEFIFSFAVRRQTKTISPFGQEGYYYISYILLSVLIHASQSGILFAHRYLPMGKKQNTLCSLWLCGEIY